MTGATLLTHESAEQEVTRADAAAFHFHPHTLSLEDKETHTLEGKQSERPVELMSSKAADFFGGIRLHPERMREGAKEFASRSCMALRSSDGGCSPVEP